MSFSASIGSDGTEKIKAGANNSLGNSNDFIDGSISTLAPRNLSDCNSHCRLFFSARCQLDQKSTLRHRQACYCTMPVLAAEYGDGTPRYFLFGSGLIPWTIPWEQSPYGYQAHIDPSNQYFCATQEIGTAQNAHPL